MSCLVPFWTVNRQRPAITLEALIPRETPGLIVCVSDVRTNPEESSSSTTTVFASAVKLVQLHSQRVDWLGGVTGVRRVAVLRTLPGPDGVIAATAFCRSATDFCRSTTA